MNGDNSLDGMRNPVARRNVQKVLQRVVPSGIVRDEDWRFVRVIWEALSAAALDWAMTGSEYMHDSDNRPVGKQWKFEVYFANEKGRRTTLYGIVTASGAGSVENPLESYDVTAYVS